MGPKKIKLFRKEIWDFYKDNKRDFPWRNTQDPYKILVSEMMLQQTQASRVLEKYSYFIKTFPNFKLLDRAPITEVLRVWSGLGYNRRAIALKKIARLVMQKYKGKLPATYKELITFPNIGDATTKSILAFAFNSAEPFIETNIRRVFIYHFFNKKEQVDDVEIIKLVSATLYVHNPRDWYFALMDYGSMLAKREINPNRKSVHYTKQKPFKGSVREIRGKIIRLLLKQGPVCPDLIEHCLNLRKDLLLSILQRMQFDGLIKIKGSNIYFPR